MSRGETALPHRVATSAKQLARSTISGIESELRCPESGKQAGTSSQGSASPSESTRDNTIPRRPDYASRENSFRSQVSATTSKAIEDDFDRFQEQQYFGAWDGTAGTPSFSTSLSDFDRLEESLHHADRLLIRSSNTESMSAGDAAASTKTVVIENIEITHTSSLDSARSSALRRLEQLGAHMQRNLAMQEAFQQEANAQSFMTTQTALSDTTQDAQSNQFQQEQTSPQEPEILHRTHTAHQTHQNHQPTSHEEPPTQPPQERDDESDLETAFHCPYYACHQNLNYFLSSSSATERRSCVHVGCGFSAGSRKDWTEHVALPHHNLQGSYQAGE
ncbi:hypothetical protein Q7P37_009327 [Cladosporium fusiforme]